MGLLEQCEAVFGSSDLYRVLGVRREASPQEIRRGYHRASLRVHPDRAEPDAKEEATRRFQSVTSLLQITVKDIEDFEKSYKDSEEEVADIKAAYVDFEGDMDRIMESVLCADYTDEPRIRKIIEKAIDSGEVPSYQCFVKESKQKMIARKRRVEKEAREAEKTKDELGLGGEDDLKALIQVR
ncbi:DNJC9 protein, partial [Aramus guarauna]|nr:DNJC9 protein [Aramus guarauna]